MKEATIYICECCNKHYQRKESAKACESMHKKIIKIINTEYIADSKYPQSITVEIEGGDFVKFKRF